MEPFGVKSGHLRKVHALKRVWVLHAWFAACHKPISGKYQSVAIRNQFLISSPIQKEEPIRFEMAQSKVFSATCRAGNEIVRRASNMVGCASMNCVER